MRHFTVPLVAAALAGATGCAPAAADAPEAPTVARWTPPEGRSCRVDPLPAALPPVAALVDSARLARALAELAPAEVLLTVRFDSVGRPDRILAIGGGGGSRTGESARSAAARAVAEHLREQGTAESAWGVRLRLVAGPTPRISVGRRKLCEAQVAESRSARGKPLVLSSAWVADGGYRRPLRVRVRIDAEGEVREARLVGSVGTPLGDERFLRGVYLRTFLPALEDGVPAERWTTLVL